MNTITTGNFINNFSEEEFESNKDKLMKLVENDSKLIAWYAWGLDILFTHFSKDDMFEYIGQVSDEELKEQIKAVETEIYHINDPGAILDNNFELLENEVIVNILNMENEINPYSFEEKEARSIYYVCSLIFWQKAHIKDIDKNHYRNLKPVTSFWIFPRSSHKLENNIRVNSVSFPIETYEYHFNKNGIDETVSRPYFKLNAKIYFCYLGSPLDIELDTINSSDKKGKLAYLIYLSDLVFGFDINKKKRLELLGKTFNLTGNSINDEVNIMSNFDELVKSLKAEGYAEAQAQEKEKYAKALEDTKKTLEETKKTLEETKEGIFKSLLNEGWSTEKAHKLVYGLK